MNLFSVMKMHSKRNEDELKYQHFNENKAVLLKVPLQMQGLCIWKERDIGSFICHLEAFKSSLGFCSFSISQNTDPFLTGLYMSAVDQRKQWWVMVGEKGLLTLHFCWVNDPENRAGHETWSLRASQLISFALRLFTLLIKLLLETNEYGRLKIKGRD